eukprot:3698755-Rhodomonas_salina.2
MAVPRQVSTMAALTRGHGHWQWNTCVHEPPFSRRLVLPPTTTTRHATPGTEVLVLTDAVGMLQRHSVSCTERRHVILYQAAAWSEDGSAQ